MSIVEPEETLRQRIKYLVEYGGLYPNDNDIFKIDPPGLISKSPLPVEYSRLQGVSQIPPPGEKPLSRYVCLAIAVVSVCISVAALLT